MRLRAACLCLSMIAVLCCPFFASAAESAVLPEEIQMYFFHETACGSCDGASEFTEIADQVLADVRHLYPYVIHRVNVFQTDGRRVFEKLTDQVGLSRENLQFPLLIVNSRIYQGLEAIRENLREAYLTAGEDIFVNQYVYWPSRDLNKPLFERYAANAAHATFVYFYRLTCEECAQLATFMAALPETIEIEGQDVSLDAIRINTRSGNNGKRITAFFEHYAVPQEDQMVPIVFFRDQYLAGAEAIEAELLTALAAGEGQGFVFPEE